MTPTIIPGPPPAGYRFMLAEETERLSHGAPVALMYGSTIERGVVQGFGDATMTVGLSSGALVVLDLDDPDFWPEGEVRARRPPMDRGGEFVALHEVLATPDAEIEPLLRVSVACEYMAKTDPELRAALAEVRRILIDRMKQRAAA
jgi:hypothetical protein